MIYLISTVIFRLKFVIKILLKDIFKESQKFQKTIFKISWNKVRYDCFVEFNKKIIWICPIETQI